jgi:hypothetical protein
MSSRNQNEPVRAKFGRGLIASSVKMKRALILGACLTAFTGCTAVQSGKNAWQYSGAWNDMMTNYRNEAWANKSWHARKHQFCREKHMQEFAEGFRAGYAEVAQGSEACTPAFAPRQYWGWKYQSAEGQEKVAAWYSGYPHGARAAEEDGIGNWTQIQTSMTLQQNLADQGMLGPGQTAGMYPMPQAQPAAAAYAKELKARGANSMVAESNEPIGSAVKPNSTLIQR